MLSLLKTQRKGAFNGMIDKIEFTAKNLLKFRKIIVVKSKLYLSL